LHTAARSHGTPNQFLIATKTEITIACPQISPSMTFSASTTERESMLHGINSLQSFKTLPLKPNSKIKTWVRMTENHIHQSPGMDRPVEFAGEDLRNTTVWLDQRGQASGQSHLDAGRNLGPPPLLKPSRAAPTPPAGRSHGRVWRPRSSVRAHRNGGEPLSPCR
jgi:hypothetical protein